MEVVGCPIVRSELSQWSRPWVDREPLVVFPHRLAPEKRPEDFDVVAALVAATRADVRFVRARDAFPTPKLMMPPPA